MQISRRKALVGGLASLIVLPFFKTSTTAELRQCQWWRKQEDGGDAELIVDDDNKTEWTDYRSVAMKGPLIVDGWGYEGDTLTVPGDTESIYRQLPQIITDEILRKTGVKYERLAIDECRGHTINLGAAVDWQLHHQRTRRWDIIGRAFELFVNSFVYKVEEAKVPGCIIRDVWVFDDPGLHKLRRVGYYGWIELEIPDAA